MVKVIGAIVSIGVCCFVLVSLFVFLSTTVDWFTNISKEKDKQLAHCYKLQDEFYDQLEACENENWEAYGEEIERLKEQLETP